MKVNGIPLSCHLMLSSGPRARMGLPSPSSRRIEEGDRFTTAYGIWGALNCRAGFVVRDERGLPETIRDYVEKLVAPYYRAIVEWYRTIGIGVEGGELYDVIHRRLGDPFFGVKLNPGHQIHLDEWVNSPIFAGSKVELRSGMAFQVDVIPATGTDYFTTNIEDGIALADEALRRELQEKFPEAWGRIEARRRFMKDVLGIDLKPEVLPFSNIPAYLPPFLLSPRRVMTVVREAKIMTDLLSRSARARSPTKDRIPGTRSRSAITTATRVVAGKTMAEHLRFAVCYWHTLRGTGSDAFGGASFERPWGTESDPVAAAESTHGRGIRALPEARRSLLLLSRPRHRSRRGVTSSRWWAKAGKLQRETGVDAPLGNGEPLQPPALHPRRRDQSRPAGLRPCRGPGAPGSRRDSRALAAPATSSGADGKATRRFSTPT